MITLSEIVILCTKPKGIKPKTRPQVKNWCKLARGVKAKRHTTNGCTARATCMSNTYNISAVDSHPIFRPLHTVTNNHNFIIETVCL